MSKPSNALVVIFLTMAICIVSVVGGIVYTLSYGGPLRVWPTVLMATVTGIVVSYTVRAMRKNAVLTMFVISSMIAIACIASTFVLVPGNSAIIIDGTIYRSTTVKLWSPLWNKYDRVLLERHIPFYVETKTAGGYMTYKVNTKCTLPADYKALQVWSRYRSSLNTLIFEAPGGYGELKAQVHQGIIDNIEQRVVQATIDALRHHKLPVKHCVPHRIP
jgi:hypothetical protein